MRVGFSIFIFSIVQLFIFYSLLNLLSPLESEPILTQVENIYYKDFYDNKLISNISPSPSPSHLSCPSIDSNNKNDDDIIPILLSKLSTTGIAVKYLHEEEGKRNIYIPVVASSKELKQKTKHSLEIASYNLWNVNLLWEQRLQHIADLLSKMDVDIIAFQEVRTLNRQSALTLLSAYRMNKDLPIEGTIEMPETSKTMMNLIYSLLPQYPWAVFVPMAKFSDGTQEGIAILSKTPIHKVITNDINVSGSFSDLNTRGVLQTRILLPESNPNDEEPLYIDIFNTHLTYDSYQQCFMITRLLDILEESYKTNPDITQILVGDMNAYITAEWPMDFIQDPFSSLSQSIYNPCNEAFIPWILSHNEYKSFPKFIDIWNEAFPRLNDGSLLNSYDNFKSLGHTFPSHKDSPLTNCRPDRILRRLDNKTQLLSVATFGDKVWYETNDFQRSRPHALSDHLGVYINIEYE